jgi:hypothetical protein
VFAGAGSFASPQAFTDGFAPAIAVGALLSLAGALAALAVPGRLGRARLSGDADVAGELLEPLPAARTPRA